MLADEIEVVEELGGPSARDRGEEEEVVGEGEDLPLVAAREGTLEEVKPDAARVQDEVGRGTAVGSSDELRQDRLGEEAEDRAPVRVRVSVEEVVCKS